MNRSNCSCDTARFAAQYLHNIRLSINDVMLRNMWRSVYDKILKLKIEMMSLSRDFRSKLVSIDRHVRDLFGPRLQSHNI